MAVVDAVRWQISIDYAGYANWTAPRYIVARVDNSSDTISVQIRDGSNNLIESPVSGPPLFSGSNGTANIITSGPPYYQYCDGTTLRYVQLINTFPYIALASSVNDSQCQISNTCDLIITGYDETPSTSPTTADGQIQGYATSSHSGIRWQLGDFVYETATNTTGLFTGLLPGTYGLYAGDSFGCYQYINATVTAEAGFNPLYRGEYDTIHDFPTKIEIIQRDYSGSTTEICFGDEPFILDYDESDKFSPFVASHCVLKLIEETADQFLQLFTADERKYRVDYYKDFGAGWVLMWTGYVVPEFYVRPFVRTKGNYVTIKASDQLGILKDEPFMDASENKFVGELSQLKIITEILKKTGLEKNIRIQDNIFESTMATDESPLAQAFADTRIFYNEKNEPLKCDEVLRQVIKCKSGLRLFQSYGYWWLVRSEYNVGSFDFFEYDFTGALVDTDTFSTVQNIVSPPNNGILWANSSQLEKFETNYGKIELTHNLGFDNNLIDTGRFEEEDVIELGNGNKTFKDWGVNIVQNNVKYGLEYVDNRDSKGAFFMDFDLASGTQGDNFLYSKDIPLESNSYGTANLIKFKFDYKGIPNHKIPWIKLAWEIKYTSNEAGTVYYLRDLKLPTDFIPWSTNINLRKNDIYISDFNSFQTFDFTVPMPDLYGGIIRIGFYMHNHSGRDFDSITSLKLVNTADPVLLGKRYIVFHDSNDVTYPGDDFTYFYELEEGNDSDSIPDTVQGPDFHATTNPRVWKAKGRIYGAGASVSSLVNKFLLDNVQFTYIPFDPGSSFDGPRNFEPPSEAFYDQVINSLNKLKYEDEFLLGDLPDMENAKDLYRGYLRLSDGTPTDLWARTDTTESKKLLALSLSERVSQLKDIQKKLQADIVHKGAYYAFINSLGYEDRRFLNIKYVLSDKNSMISLEAVEMTTGDDGEPPVQLGAFSDAYSDAFDNGE
jgi:hypothetical protein